MGLPTIFAAKAWAKLWHHSDPRVTPIFKKPSVDQYMGGLDGFLLAATLVKISQASNWVNGTQEVFQTVTGVLKTLPTTIVSGGYLTWSVSFSIIDYPCNSKSAVFDYIDFPFIC
jgi:hypothetical protein